MFTPKVYVTRLASSAPFQFTLLFLCKDSAFEFFACLFPQSIIFPKQSNLFPQGAHLSNFLSISKEESLLVPKILKDTKPFFYLALGEFESITATEK